MSLFDVGKFKTLDKFPVRVCFWRGLRETIVHHRCPLWSDVLGLSPSKSIGLDLLHTYYLGPLLEFSKVAVWMLLDSPIWGNKETLKSDNFLVAMSCLKNDLFNFYGEHDKKVVKKGKRSHASMT